MKFCVLKNNREKRNNLQVERKLSAKKEKDRENAAAKYTMQKKGRKME